jgi:hypothetical protein
MKKYNESAAIDRFKLAVSERNIRALYVRLFGIEQPETALDRGTKYITKIAGSMKEEGFTVGPVTSLPGIPYSRVLILIMGLSVVGGGIFFVNKFLPPRWTILFAILGLLGWTGLLFVKPLLARKAFALLAVLVFPVLSVTTVVKDKGRSIKDTLMAFLKMSSISFIGAIIMTGILADKSFMLKLDQFSGVKLAHIIPLLIIPAYFFLYENRKKYIDKINEILVSPLLVWQTLAALFILAALAIYIIRTGNDAPTLVSSWETKFRDILDQILFVRPRTKEFLIGHPIMLVLLYYGYSQKKLPLLILGIIGQISLVNTYAHIHTPLVISLLRSFHGIWIGILFGVVAIAVLQAAYSWYLRRLSNG